MRIVRNLSQVANPHGVSPDAAGRHWVDLHLGVFSGVMPADHLRHYPQRALKELDPPTPPTREGLQALRRRRALPSRTTEWLEAVALQISFRRQEKRRYPKISLAEARLRRAEFKVALAKGVDPGAKEVVVPVLTFAALRISDLLEVVCQPPPETCRTAFATCRSAMRLCRRFDDVAPCLKCGPSARGSLLCKSGGCCGHVKSCSDQTGPCVLGNEATDL